MTAPAKTPHEPKVHPTDPLPHGYVFVRKGNVYITSHIRKQTHSAQMTVYIVSNPRTHKPLGLRVPRAIYLAVLASHESTRESRLLSTQRRDARTAAALRESVQKQFPRIPDVELEKVVARATRKGSGRVGRTGTLGLAEKARLAVRAHVRHGWTGYEGLLREGVGREEARRRIGGRVEEVVGEWEGRGKKGKEKKKEKGERVREKSGKEKGKGEGTRKSAGGGIRKKGLRTGKGLAGC
ncbi:hypothetical protein F4778DRAFT_125086 [Xylariomycetidae sp. FL2044]|nr:hypothetical protein F4778DRAFT_125086 [Xylariomycetidae sp. FL2044]